MFDGRQGGGRRTARGRAGATRRLAGWVNGVLVQRAGPPWVGCVLRVPNNRPFLDHLAALPLQLVWSSSET
jgi:hypothetical protein